jgi:hypothetical protein
MFDKETILDLLDESLTIMEKFKPQMNDDDLRSWTNIKCIVNSERETKEGTFVHIEGNCPKCNCITVPDLDNEGVIKCHACGWDSDDS